jgi:hypothetical protein
VNNSHNIEAYAKGVSQLTKLYDQNQFQSFISFSSDMLAPVESPEILYPGLTEFPYEIFTKLIITDLVFKDKPNLRISSNLITELKDFQCDDGIFNFFNDDCLLPADIDCTAIGQAILVETGQANLHIVHQVVDRILDTVNEDGIIQVYFPPCGHRSYVDPVVGVNALYLIALLGREKEAQKTEDYIFEHIRTQAYLAGTRYYPSPDIFLYFLARLINKFSYFRERFGDQLRQSLKTRIGHTQLPLDLAARVITAKVAGISNKTDEDGLIRSKNGCDGWPADAFFRFGTRHGFFGCEALTTAFAIKALKPQTLHRENLMRYGHNVIFPYRRILGKNGKNGILSR